MTAANASTPVTAWAQPHTTLPWYVPLAVAAFLVNAWVSAGVSPLAATRTFIVAVVVAIALVLIVGVTWGRNLQRAGLVVGWVAIGMSGVQADILDMAGRIGGWQGTLWLIAIAGAALILLRLGWRSISAPGGLERLTRRLNVFAILLLVAVAMTAWLDGALGAAVEELRGAPSPPSTLASADASHPDIYVLLLDGYPRADTLQERFDFDNGPFLAALAQREFSVASQSRTNYMFTQLVLLSFLHMRHAADIALDPPLDSIAHVNRSVRRAINDAPAIHLLREAGYSVVASSPGYESVVLRQADVFMESDTLNEFERHLLRRAALFDPFGFVAPDWLPSQHRERVMSNFDDLREVAATSSTHPRFMLVHVPAPHTPHVFEADGSPVQVPDLRAFYGDTPELMKVSREEFKAQVRGQIEYLNHLLLDAVDEVLESSDEPPVIIVMSDHGTRMDVTYGDLADPDLDERMNNLFAAYTPGLDDPFGDGITPVNILPILFNAYLGESLPCQPDSAFVTGTDSLLDLHPLPPTSAESDPACGRSVTGGDP